MQLEEQIRGSSASHFRPLPFVLFTANRNPISTTSGITDFLSRQGLMGTRAHSTNSAKIKGSAVKADPLFFLVPEVGIEPTLSQGEGDFESPASTSFTTPACGF